MRGRVIEWSPGMERLGRVVLAIGVFDGVHLGHRALLREAVDEARKHSARAVALTFDRDPDQVVTPESAASQLLTLEDKCRFILDAGVDLVLVVPFTPQVAAMPAETFLDEVVGTCCDVSSIHVGADFRFGARAAGDIDTLYVWAAENNADVWPHELVEVDGEAVTSTRIRGLVARGLVVEAARLLGRPTRVTGVVHQGRQQGAAIGFATANIDPVAFAAVPAEGVYAGRAETAGGEVYPAAISVGVPPSFPEARDSLEAHLLGYEGDLYESRLVLEFIDRLRDQRAFSSLEELKSAIAADVGSVERIAASYKAPSAQAPADWDENPFAIFGQIADALLGGEESVEYLEDGTPVIEDPEALEEAERAAAGLVAPSEYDHIEEEWVELVGPRALGGLYGDPGFTSSIVTAPLTASGIPFAWSPYPPELAPSSIAIYGTYQRTFTLLVPESRLAEARQVMRVVGMPAVESAEQRVSRSPAPPPPAVVEDEIATPWVRWVVLGGVFLLIVLAAISDLLRAE